jgi:hypothetical protein
MIRQAIGSRFFRVVPPFRPEIGDADQLKCTANFHVSCLVVVIFHIGLVVSQATDVADGQNNKGQMNRLTDGQMLVSHNAMHLN